jgi:hypothetical protein
VINGSESTSLRLPPRHPLRVAVQLVRGATLRGAAPRGHRDQEVHQEKAVSRRHLEGRDRPDRRQGRGQHLHGASRDPDRKARRGSGNAEGGSQPILRAQGDLHQHQGDPEGRARRAARGGECRAPAGKARRFPTRDEEGSDVDDGIARAAFRCTPCAPRSTTDSPRPRRRTASSA